MHPSQPFWNIFRHQEKKLRIFCAELKMQHTYNRKRPISSIPDLVHSDSSLDSGSHSIHPCTHPQEVNGLVFLTDGIFCMDPGCLHITPLNSLWDKVKRSINTYIMQILALESKKPTCFTLAFSVLCSLSHFLELRLSSFAANLRLNRCSVWLVKGCFIVVRAAGYKSFKIQSTIKAYKDVELTQTNSVWVPGLN